ncbi:M23 family metallopeptidase [Candidatus Parcubacteria bacterium]|nr:M23 family metallopeptidase [Candidatus Parcubacteria bacterium]
MTYAGVFSFVQSLFITNVEAQDVVYHNSQTIPLLAASISPDPDADKGGPEVSFDETGMFIVAETGLFSLLPGEYVSATGKEENVYIVRPGDTLSHIAELFNVKSETIRWRNDLGAKEYIRAGQDLKIPPADGVYHKIKKGDTLGGIAKAYKAETSAIKTFNGVVDASGLQVGKEIFIPGGKSSVAVKTQTSSSSQKSTYVKVLSSVPSQISSDKLGEWMWPVNGGVVTQGYGSTSFANRSGYYKGNNHGGVDIGAPRGTAIVAAKDGVVTMSQWYYGYGNLVEIKHDDGTITRYGHNTSNSVKKGQRVVQGQVIAKLGSTGRVTGPHVHFEIRDANGKQMEDNVFYQTYLNY